ncbi:hypothetical protein MNBD_GAMMA25-301 [hydrothermal vent metagenome]|uniref:Thioesterase domain-containing protein n=1 Tax=hydrothermal vent metagenome TaxID=652676 RepID=A0A3B1BF97_9ZZZZ
MINGFPIRVEFEDVDSYKIAHHTKLLAYMERARTLYFRNDGISLKKLPFAILVYQVSMRFIKPAKLFDELIVTAKIRECDGYTFKVDQKIFRDDELLVKAQVVHALQDFTTYEMVLVPDSIINMSGI